MHKVHNMLHSLVVDLGSWSKVKTFCDRVVSITTDHGVESLLVEAPTCILTGEYLPNVGRESLPEQQDNSTSCVGRDGGIADLV